MKRGVTLVELMIALICMVVMVGVVYQLIVTTERIHIHTGARAEVEYNIREAMDLVVSEVRHAGYRYWNRMNEGGGVFNYNMERIDSNESGGDALTVLADFDENGAVGDGETIRYRVVDRDLRRETLVGGAWDWDIVANNIERITFTYYDGEGNRVTLPAAPDDADRIRRIDIEIEFSYPVREEGKTLTTTIDTTVKLRNTHYKTTVMRP
jgi:type II secretory pathway component PulJ